MILPRGEVVGVRCVGECTGGGSQNRKIDFALAGGTVKRGLREGGVQRGEVQ